MKAILSGVVAMLAFAPAALAGERLPLNLVRGAKQEIVLSGQSTMHPYSSKSTTFELKGELSGEGLGTSVDADALEKGAVTALEVKLPTRSLKSGKEDLDKNLHKTLKAEEFPVIRFRLQTAKTIRGTGDVFAVKTRGLLTVAGVEREVDLEATVTASGGRLLLTGGTDLKMSDFGITPPSFLFGAMKTEDRIHIQFTVSLDSPVVATR